MDEAFSSKSWSAASKGLFTIEQVDSLMLEMMSILDWRVGVIGTKGIYSLLEEYENEFENWKEKRRKVEENGQEVAFEFEVRARSSKETIESFDGSSSEGHSMTLVNVTTAGTLFGGDINIPNVEDLIVPIFELESSTKVNIQINIVGVEEEEETKQDILKLTELALEGKLSKFDSTISVPAEGKQKRRWTTSVLIKIPSVFKKIGKVGNRKRRNTMAI